MGETFWGLALRRSGWCGEWGGKGELGGRKSCELIVGDLSDEV